MDRWFSSDPFIPSFTSILPFSLVTFPLLNLRHAISPCAEADTDTAAPARVAFHAVREAARRRRISWKGLDTSFSTSPRPARPSSRSGPSALPPTRTLAGGGDADACCDATPRPRAGACGDTDACGDEAKTPTVAVAVVAMAVVTTQTVAATGVAAAVAIAGYGGGDNDDRRRRLRRRSPSPQPPLPSLAMAAAATTTPTVAVAIADRHCFCP